MAPGQDKPSASSVLIDHALDTGKQRRETLHFIQDTAVFYLAEETPRIGFSRHADIREYFEGRWKPAKWEPSKAIASWIEFHGPEDSFPRYMDGMNHQQGHMECLLCHTDHNK